MPRFTMTNQEAVRRLEHNRDYREQIRKQRADQGLPTYHQDADLEAIDLAIAALDFAIRWQAYEQSQPKV